MNKDHAGHQTDLKSRKSEAFPKQAIYSKDSTDWPVNGGWVEPEGCGAARQVVRGALVAT